MLTMTAGAARLKLLSLIDQVATSHEPVLIEGNHNRAVLVSEEVWRAINDTLHQEDGTGAVPFPIEEVALAALINVSANVILGDGQLSNNCD